MAAGGNPPARQAETNGEEVMVEPIKPTVVVFLCRGCRASFCAVQRRTERPTSGKFKCSKCNADVYRWDGRYDYKDWKLDA